jgi:hypothetical protein
MASAGRAPAAAELPFLSAPHDNLRHGLPALKADALPSHPVEAIQRNVRLRCKCSAAGAVLRRKGVSTP